MGGYWLLQSLLSTTAISLLQVSQKFPGGHFDKHWLMNFIISLLIFSFDTLLFLPLEDTSVYRGPKAFLKSYLQVLVSFSLFCYFKF